MRVRAGRFGWGAFVLLAVAVALVACTGTPVRAPHHVLVKRRPVGCPGTRAGVLSCTTPAVTVSPSTRLRPGEHVVVRVSGFGVRGKVFLSECASAADVSAAGCGPALSAQRHLMTAADRAASGAFAVSVLAPASPFSFAGIRRCHRGCVIVATAGLARTGDYAYVTISFGR
jgi:hypothetical protein